MEKKKTSAQEERDAGVSVALFSIVISFIAVLMCTVVLILTVQVAKRPPSNENLPPVTEDKTQSDQPPENTPSAPVFKSEGAAVRISKTENTKSVTDEIDSLYGILVDAQTGEILAGKNADTRFNPASMTKIMTLLVACERLTEKDLDESVTFTAEIQNYVRPNSGGYKDSECFWADVGDGSTVRAQLYGIGVQSAADCTMMVITYIVGKSPAESEATFVQWMNEKAIEMGLQNTHFDNVIGHESDQNYSTVADMAAILAHALECPLIREILSTESWRGSGFGYSKDGTFNPSFGITFYSTLFNANPGRPSREKSYSERYGEFSLKNASFCGGKTGSLESPASTWHYSLASFATFNGKTYVAITGETQTSAEVLKDAKVLYDAYVK